MKLRGQKPLPKEKLKKSYRSGAYSRIAIYPKTHETIRKKALKAGEHMIDWLDKVVKKA